MMTPQPIDPAAPLPDWLRPWIREIIRELIAEILPGLVATRGRFAEPSLPGVATKLVESGVVTEAVVVAAASASERLVLSPGVLITPSARDAARRLGITLERET